MREVACRGEGAVLKYASRAETSRDKADDVLLSLLTEVFFEAFHRFRRLLMAAESGQAEIPLTGSAEAAARRADDV